MLTKKDVEQILFDEEFSVLDVQGILKNDLIPFVKKGKQKLYELKDVIAFIKEQAFLEHDKAGIPPKKNNLVNEFVIQLIVPFAKDYSDYELALNTVIDVVDSAVEKGAFPSDIYQCLKSPVLHPDEVL